MNQMVKEFNHPLTHFENPHGLGNKSQFSTASELGEACLRFIKNSVMLLLFSYFMLFVDVGITKVATMRVKKVSNGKTQTFCWGKGTKGSKLDLPQMQGDVYRVCWKFNP